MNLIKGIFFTCLLLALHYPQLGIAQDIHFSQYYASPMNLNPALTGQFDGDYRIVGNFRNQWSSITIPYKTFGVSGDARYFLNNPFVHTGLAVYNDVTGDSEFTSTQIMLSGAFSYPLDHDSIHVINFGLQPTYHTRSIDYSKLRFDNQYSVKYGHYDPSLPSGENFNKSNENLLDLNTGFTWRINLSPRNNFTSGIGIYHLFEPESELFDSDEVHRRMTYHINGQLKMASMLDALPGISFMSQGQSEELVFGSSFRYLINGFSTLHLGYWYRNNDAGFVTAGLTHQNVYAGFSYDFNSSDLKEASNGRGGVEFSIIYIIRKFDKRISTFTSCPDYI